MCEYRMSASMPISVTRARNHGFDGLFCQQGDDEGQAFGAPAREHTAASLARNLFIGPQTMRCSWHNIRRRAR